MTNSFMLEPFIFVSYNIKRTHVRNIYAETATVVEGMKKTCTVDGLEKSLSKGTVLKQFLIAVVR